MRHLLVLVFVGVVGCNGDSPPPEPPAPAQPMRLEVPEIVQQQAVTGEGVFTFYIAEQNGIVIHADGEVELEEGLELSEASVRFWKAVAQAYREQIAAICAEREKE